MKTPKDYLVEMQMDDDILFNRYEVSVWLSDFIKEVQVDSYNEAIEYVLENIELNLKSTDENAVYYKKAISCEFNGYSSTITVDEDSILKLKIE